MNTQTSRNVNGIILTGGKSTRMGTPKAFLQINGHSFLEHVVKAVKPLVDQIILVGQPALYTQFDECIRIEDEIPHSGPLSGIYTGLKYSNTPYNLILSCDVPSVTSSLLERLIEHRDKAQVVAFQNGSYLSSLTALYHKSALKTVENTLKNGDLKLGGVLKKLSLHRLEANAIEAKQLENINTPIQFNQLKALYAS